MKEKLLIYLNNIRNITLVGQQGELNPFFVLLFYSVGTYARREGGRGSSWSAQVPAVAHRETYTEPRGGQSNFARGPLPSRQPQASKDAFPRTQLFSNN